MQSKKITPIPLGLFLIMLFSLPVSAQLSLKLKATRPTWSEQADRPASEPLPSSQEAKVGATAEIIFSNGDYKSFDEAKKNAVNYVRDGDHLWMYVKFPGPAGNYIPHDPDAGLDEDGLPIHTLRTALGPENASELWNIWTMRYAQRELNGPELKINLAPGVPGRNKSSNSFLRTVGEGKTGVWKNAVIIYCRFGQNLGTAPITCDVAAGLSKYKQMSASWFNIISAGTAEENQLPQAGRFSDAGVRAQCISKLRQARTRFSNFYFTSNNWASVSESGKVVAREVEAAFTYKEKNDCMFGTIVVRQNYNALAGKYGSSELKIGPGKPYTCK